MIIILGKTSSGKDRTVNELVSNHGFKKLTTYTTRPIRKGEKEGVTYHYINTEDFLQKVEEGFFAEWKDYKTKDGLWYYGTALEDLEKSDNSTVIILTPEGYKDIANKLSTKPIAIYIYANNETIKKRLVKRGDNEVEAKRRLEHDNEDFKCVEQMVDKIIYNNEGTNIDDVVNKILEFVRSK